MNQVLTIAGSDSGGGAGLQADLKTMTQFGVYGVAGELTSQKAEQPAGYKVDFQNQISQLTDQDLADYQQLTKISIKQ